ncbi:MAG: DNA-3-methyladenine glycosylase 2 family protein [Lachnospiraceae bacterium]|nr:DNA-3-methyladenine glycosylase 2 family protein [Lachnospiraceae bacterium]
MNIKEENKKVYISDLEDFSLQQTLECGQCFNFEKINDEKDEYVVIAMNRLLHISQENDNIIFHNITTEDINLWVKYFDLDRDYGVIKKTLVENAPELKKAIEDKWGVRILNQEFNETLMSFIISQNKQIPHIKQIVRMLSENYGRHIGSINGKDYYSFPDVLALSNIGIEGYQKCKTGFRAKYLADASEKLKSGLNAQSFENLEYEEALSLLKEIKGVGDKVANCVLLFSLGYRSAFPVDVWIKRAMEDVYFKKETPNTEIMEFAKERFGIYGGYAQQYLFYHIRGDGK